MASRALRELRSWGGVPLSWGTEWVPTCDSSNVVLSPKNAGLSFINAITLPLIDYALC